MLELFAIGALVLVLMSSGDDKKSPSGPRKLPDVKETEDDIYATLDEEKAKTYTAADAEQLGRDEGYEVGYAHGANGKVQTSPVVPLKFDEGSPKQDMYDKGYLAGYKVGAAEGAADFAGVVDGDRPTADGGGFGKQPGKDTSTKSDPIIDSTTARGATRGAVAGVRRHHRR